jgi:hypothetical protein
MAFLRVLRNHTNPSQLDTARPVAADVERCLDERKVVVSAGRERMANVLVIQINGTFVGAMS